MDEVRKPEDVACGDNPAKTEKASENTTGRGRGRRSRDLGRRGEDAAARFLYQHGYDILERNWTCEAGEADIIARDEESLVFVEVKTRSDCEKGFPAEAVTPDKRDRYEALRHR